MMFRYVNAICLLPLYMYPKTHKQTTGVSLLINIHQYNVTLFIPILNIT